MKVCRIKIGNVISYELVDCPPTPRACMLFTLTETYDKEHEPYDFEMPFGDILVLSDLINDVLSFLLINDDRIYPKPGIDHETIYDELREMMCVSASITPDALILFDRIDEYEAAYNA